MVRKKRTDAGGESSQSHDTGVGSGRGPQRPSQQGGGGGYLSGRGSVPQSQQAGRGGYGGGGGRGRGMSQQQEYAGGPLEYQGRGRGGPTQLGGRGGYGVSRGGGGSGGGPFTSGPSRPPVPELHQATQPFQAAVTLQPASTEAGSSSRPPELAPLVQQLQHLSIQQEVGGAIQPVPPSSKSVRFPLRPGKGCSGTKCTVKANHFFAELPDKDLHQYDVSSFVISVFYHCFCPFLLVLDFYCKWK